MEGIFGGYVKTIQCGNRKEIFRVDNSLYLATFIIPVGSVYFTNEEVVNNIRFKKTQASDNTLRLNLYYKDKTSYIKVVISDGYVVTKVTPSGKCLGIYQFLSNTVEFLKYYEMCSKFDWECALNKLNMWLKDASLKVKEL